MARRHWGDSVPGPCGRVTSPGPAAQDPPRAPSALRGERGPAGRSPRHPGHGQEAGGAHQPLADRLAGGSAVSRLVWKGSKGEACLSSAPGPACGHAEGQRRGAGHVGAASSPGGGGLQGSRGCDRISDLPGAARGPAAPPGPPTPHAGSRKVGGSVCGSKRHLVGLKPAPGSIGPTTPDAPRNVATSLTRDSGGVWAGELGCSDAPLDRGVPSTFRVSLGSVCVFGFTRVAT